MLIGRGGVAAAMAAGAVLWLGSFFDAGSPVGIVQRVADAAWSSSATEPGGRLPPLAPGDRIDRGRHVETGHPGRVALLLASGHSLRMDAGTRLQFLDSRTLTLERGAIYVDSGGTAGGASESLEILTPHGRVRELGTQFEVRVEHDQLLLRVREGVVTLQGSGEARILNSGEELTIDAAGNAARREIDPFSPAWEWIGAVTPMIDLTGHSLLDFLDWQARERGLRLVFDPAEQAETAGGVALSGSIQGMTLDEALGSILATTGMQHRIEEDALIIFADTESRR